MADHELIDESERDRFADVVDRDGDGVDDRREHNGTGTLDDDHERPARFNRDEETTRRDQPSRY